MCVRAILPVFTILRLDFETGQRTVWYFLSFHFIVYNMTDLISIAHPYFEMMGYK
jgi:hypothetical protein